MPSHEHPLAREQAWRLLLETALDGIWAVDSDGRLVEVNRIYCEMSGYSREELLGRSVADLDDNPSTVPSQFARLEALGADRFERQHRRRDGTTFIAEISAKTWREAGLHIGFIRDVTARREADDALRASEARALQQAREDEARFRRIVDASPVPLATNDDEHRITLVNEAFVRTFGYTLEDIPTLEVWWPLAYPDPEYREHIKGVWNEHATRALAENRPFDPIEARVRCKNGETRTVLVGATPLSARAHLVLLYDITDRTRAEETHQRLQQQLTQSQKMESVGRLAGGVAHDFNNMLNVMLGRLDMAVDKLPPDHAVRADLDEMRRVALRSADLTRQLLAFARQQPVTPRPLDLNDVVSQTLKMLRHLISEDIALTWRPGGDAVTVCADVSQLHQVLMNLCLNARDAIDGVGHIAIGTRHVRLSADAAAAIPDASPGRYAVLQVIDDGCGMPADVLSRIFEPFFTTKEVGHGTGLGLSMVYGIARQHGGFIDVTSAPGAGTTFSVYFPPHVGPVQTGLPEVVPVANEPAVGGSETVLLVEDEHDLLGLTAAMLDQLGYETLAASRPSQAMQLAAAHEGRIDVLITDVVLPEMNGRDLARRLQDSRPDLCVVYTSGYSAEHIAHHGLLAPDLHFIPKPWSRAELATIIRRALALKAHHG